MNTSSIRVLPARLANQIAAGEVVERPASVVKELVENSIDAGANNIVVEIEQGGHKRIAIRDNGKGIVKEELKLALSRHATSKIYDLEDLDSIMSMGFRGEALASISSVSRCSLTSKPENQEAAWQAFAEGRDMDVELKPAAHPNGTTVEVLDLFYNTPARRRFLRAAKTEFQHIEQVVKRIALSHPNISFELKHNHKKILKYTATNAEKRVEQICKPAFVSEMATIKYEYEDVVISGWVSKAGVGFDNNDKQYLFINKRMMKDRLLMHGIRQAYEGMLPDAKHPAFVLFLDLPPDALDVNVHPAKHEVRFRQGRKVHDAVFQGISEVLLSSLHSKQARESDVAVSEYDASHFNPPHLSHRHDYIRPLQSVSNANSSSKPVSSEALSLVPRIAKSISNRQNHLSSKENDKITEAGRNYQSLMRTSAESAVSKDLPECLLVDDVVMVVVKEGESTALHALSLASILSAFVSHKFNSLESVKQPLLMPVSFAKQHLPNEATVNEGECDRLLAQVIETINSSDFSVSLQSGRVVLKQVPSMFRQLPWAKIFPELISALFKEQARFFSQEKTAFDSQELALNFNKIFAESWAKHSEIDTTRLRHFVLDADIDLSALCAKEGKKINLLSLLS
ncbi:DNA mismatch repair endonuclease MutL [Agaribacter flavus]|uniref:DNA mismatch repair protein MutL n=1 Tax=Agaribacter flavus TaxID=1902781 RepID=A0ABV7FPQ8_9ALTE